MPSTLKPIASVEELNHEDTVHILSMSSHNLVRVVLPMGVKASGTIDNSSFTLLIINNKYCFRNVEHNGKYLAMDNLGEPSAVFTFFTCKLLCLTI